MRPSSIGPKNPGLLYFRIDKPGQLNAVFNPGALHFVFQNVEVVAGAANFKDKIGDDAGE